MAAPDSGPVPAVGAATPSTAVGAATPSATTPALLAGKVVVVCGIGPGLGRAIAVQSARAGADVVLAARTEGLAKEVAAEVSSLGRRAVTVMTDVTDDELAAGLPAAALEAFGRVDALVNNAFAIPSGPGLRPTCSGRCG
jgi:NAD(P)-dependent dehydrogenase (short-subunit alcohol dehydrogenase family)